MCRVKVYTGDMHQYLNSVLLRLDTYLLPKDLEKQITALKEMSGGTPKEVPFDEMTQQIIDIDSVATLHNLYIDNILDANSVMVLQNANLNGIQMDIYANRYFIAFDIPATEESISSLIQGIADTYLTQCEIPVEYCFLRLNYSKDKFKDIWSVFDKSAFPVLEDTYYNGLYTDTIDRGNLFIDLNRSISPSDQDGDKYDVSVQTKAFFRIQTLQEAKERINTVIKDSEKEISRCFKE